MLVRVFAPGLVWIEHGERGRRACFFVRQVVIGDDHVETHFARPVEWFVSAYAAVDADDEFVAIGESLFECRLLNAVAFSEAMWNVESGVCAEEFESTQKNGGAGCSINVVVTVDQNGLSSFDRFL